MIRLTIAVAIGMTVALTASSALTDALVARCWWPGMAGSCDLPQFAPDGLSAPAEPPAAEPGEDA